MHQIERKTVMVFGAAGGIGRCIVDKLKSDYYIIAVDKKKEVYCLEDESISALRLDLRSLDSQKTMKTILDDIAGLYGVIFATGIMIPGSIGELSEKDWNDTMEINVNMIFRLIKGLLPYLTKMKESHIITLASHLGVVGAYNLAAYSTSKAAIIELTKCIALDYGEQGIIANCISPGFVKSEMMKDALKHFATSKKWMYASGGLPKQHIDPKDIAGMVAFLLQQTSMNGENIIIDAGYTIR